MDILVDKRIRNYSRVLLLAACTMFILLGYFVYWESKDAQLQSFNEIGLHYTQFAKKAVTDNLSADKVYANIIAGNEYVIEYSKKPYDLMMKYRAEQFMKSVIRDISGYSAIWVMPDKLPDLPIRIFHEGGDREDVLMIDPTYFEFNSCYISPIKLIDGKQEFTLVTPVYDQGELVGQVVLIVDVTEFIKRFIFTTRFKETGYMIITDENNQLIAHPEDSHQTGYIEAIVEDVFSKNESETTFSRTTEGIERYYYLEQVQYSTADKQQVMHIIYTQESQELYNFNKHIMFSTIQVISIFVVFFTVLTLLYGRRYIRLINADTKLVVEETLDHEVEKQTRELRKIAETDSLTGLYNHGSMYKIIESEIELSHVTGEPLTLMMLDLDYFKDVNDNYGHQTGDEVLKRVSELLRENIRDLDVPGRYGGEEFIILLKNIHLDKGYIIAERIRTTVLSTEFTTQKLKISISIGISEWDGDDVAALIKKADKRLYASKTYGRNKTTF